MKYYLKIGTREFPNVSQMEITGVYRVQSTQTTLGGSYLVDRVGNEKIRLVVKINLLTVEDMNYLRLQRDSISTTVTFDRGDSRTTKTMMITELVEPSPLYLYGDKENGIRYPFVNLTFEEL